MAWRAPIRLPLATGDQAFNASMVAGVFGAVAFAPLYFQRYLPPWSFWLAVGLIGAWALLLLLVFFLVAWPGRASDVRVDGDGLTILSGPHRGLRFTWAQLGGGAVTVARDGSSTTLSIGALELHRTNVEEEVESLEALAETLRAGAADRVPDAPAGPEVSRCATCGAPLVPSAEERTRCRFCEADNVLPERVRHVAAAEGASARVQQAVRALSRWPRSGVLNALVLASGLGAVLGWPFFASAALILQEDPDAPLIKLLTLFGLGYGAAVTFASHLAVATTDRRSFELLSARFAARPPPEPDQPYGCRHCGGPLPEPFGRSTTPAVSVCAYCKARNVVGLGLAREAKAERSDADTLEALASRRLGLRRRRRARAIVPVVLVLLSPVGFADVMFELPCVGAGASCESPDEMRWCVDGEREPLRCGGPRGCARDGLRVYCDQSVAVPGERCGGAEGSAACTEDGLGVLRCEDGRYALAAVCRGPEGCHPEGERVWCDASRAQRGDPCQGDALRCSVDARAMLACRDGEWSDLFPCRGPAGCDAETGRCDRSLGLEGDRCVTESATTCRVDGAALLRCEAGALVLARDCAGGCVAEGERVVCRLRP